MLPPGVPRLPTRYLIGPDFPGGEFPVGCPVSFEHRGVRRAAKVTSLALRGASVADREGQAWSVPYSLLQRAPGAPPPRCSLEEADRAGRDLLRRHTASGELAPGWEFGFDLAKVRAGVCRPSERRIEISVSYCLRAGREAVEKTILHEIAHAIVGIDHGHDEVWKRTAVRIGAGPEACHDTEHTRPKWVGACGCDRRWTRHRLSRRLRYAHCAKCRKPIAWEFNAEGVSEEDGAGPAEPPPPGGSPPC